MSEHSRALQRSIAARLGLASHDELRVVDAILTRLELGRERYGALNLRADSRDWRREGDEELVDLAVYRACERISIRDTQVAAIEAGPDEIDATTPNAPISQPIGWDEF